MDDGTICDGDKLGLRWRRSSCICHVDVHSIQLLCRLWVDCVSFWLMIHSFVGTDWLWDSGMLTYVAINGPVYLIKLGSRSRIVPPDEDLREYWTCMFAEQITKTIRLTLLTYRMLQISQAVGRCHGFSGTQNGLCHRTIAKEASQLTQARARL